MSKLVRSGTALIAAFGFVASLHTSHAEDIQIMIDGIGAAKCSDVNAAIKTKPDEVANAVANWSFGYLTRRNVERAMAHQNQIDLPAKGVTPTKLLDVVLGVCQTQPEHRVYEVVDALYE